MVKEAEADGRKDAVEALRIAWERERRNLDRFQSLLRTKGWPDNAGGAAEASAAGMVRVDTQMEEATGKVRRERARVSSVARIREAIFGMQDGLISTAILVSSVYGATGENAITIIAGLAGGLGGVVSMSAGSFLSSRAEREVKEAEIAREAREFHENPATAVAEMIVILHNEGLSEAAAVLIAETLAQNEEVLLRTMIEKELGLSPEIDTVPWKDAAVMGASFLVGAAVPVVPYVFLHGTVVVVASLFATALGLFAMGAGKTWFTKRNPVRSGLEVLGIGLLAAGLGYALGTIVPGFFGM
jgi:VIT1/CCC1 family predicted Fe2+/Mn2+ transporter